MVRGVRKVRKVREVRGVRKVRRVRRVREVRRVRGVLEVLVLAATEFEVDLLKSSCKHVVVGGIGAVNTAYALTKRLSHAPKPSLVIQTGVAGAYVPANVAVGSVLLADTEIYGDVGVSTLGGWRPLEEIGIPLVPATDGQPPRFNYFPLDASLVARAASAAGALVARTGRFVTLSQVTGIRADGDALFERFGALCESMEGAAAAHVCALYDVPFLEVRGVSNLVEDRDRSKWRLAEAARAAQHVVMKLLEQLP